jgi:hypothetical protein
MADFCIATKMSPSEYKMLKLVEVNAFVEALEERGGNSIEDELGDLL